MPRPPFADASLLRAAVASLLSTVPRLPSALHIAALALAPEPSTRYAQLISPHSPDPLKHHLMSGVPTSPCLPLSFIRSRTAAMAAPTPQSKRHRSRDRTRSRSSGGGYTRMARTNLSSSYILGKARIRPSGPI